MKPKIFCSTPPTSVPKLPESDRMLDAAYGIGSNGEPATPQPLTEASTSIETAQTEGDEDGSEERPRHR